jgi:DNA polymerase III alpha subunit
VPAVIARLKEIGATVAPITDTASTFGFARWARAAKKEGLRPVFGVELSVTPSPSAKKPVMDRWTFLALDSLAPLHKLIALATEQFRYEPLLTYQQAQQALGVFKIAGSACLLAEISPAPGLAVGLGPSTPRGLALGAIRAGHQLVAVGDNRYPCRGDLPLYEMVIGRDARDQTYEQHILAEEEWMQSVSRLRLPDGVAAGALANAREIVGMSRATMRRAKLVNPHAEKSLRELCEEGARRRGINLDDPVYRERLDRELRIIGLKRLDDYFHVVSDIMQFSRERMLCGPARGSAAGSLVSYLIGITSIDPITADLLFERFLDVTRGGWFYNTPWVEQVMKEEER